LYGWREDRAKALDRAPFRIVQNETLIAVSQAAPRDLAAMRAVPGMSSALVERFGAEFLDIVARGLETPVDALPRRERMPRGRLEPEAEQRFERLKQLRNDRARELGLEPGVLGANAALQSLARQAAGSGEESTESGAELRRWQRAALGESRILAALAGPAGRDGTAGS
jgi:ribonuclease D